MTAVDLLDRKRFSPLHNIQPDPRNGLKTRSPSVRRRDKTQACLFSLTWFPI
jgi:hypothetical protein